MRFSSALFACAVAISTLAAEVGVARAGEEDGRTLFAAGRELRAAGKCDEAIVQFRRALEAFPEGLGALRNIAECEEQLGMYAAARRDWWDLRRAVLQTNQPKYEGWDKDAQQAYARLAPKVARVVIKLDGASPERVKVVIDGKPLDPRLVGVELERDLGQHTAEAFYGGAAPVSEKFTLTEGTHQAVTLTIPAGAPGETPSSMPTSSSAEAPTSSPSSGSGLRTAGFVALGVGAVGAVGLAASIVVRQSALSTIKASCDYQNEACPSDLQSAHDRGVAASTLANVFGAVAIVGVGAGVTLVAIGAAKSSGSKRTGRTAAVTLAPNANGATLTARGAF